MLLVSVAPALSKTLTRQGGGFCLLGVISWLGLSGRLVYPPGQLRSKTMWGCIVGLGPPLPFFLPDGWQNEDGDRLLGVIRVRESGHDLAWLGTGEIGT